MRVAHFRFSTSLHRRTRMQDVLLFILLTVCGMVAQSQKPAAPETKSSLATAIDRTLEQGHDAILPPHVSHLLGISPQEQEVPVKQALQMGEPIRGFEVSTAQPNNVVIWIESRAQRQTTYYLMSRRGTLRKVLAVVGGNGYARRPNKDDQEAFEHEKQRWVDQLAPKHP